jgi:DNA-binding NarL/FixJ family response regulator
MRRLLESQRGWRVVAEATNGIEAVEKVRSLKPDVAIIDIEMPKLDGLQAIRQVRETAPNTEVLVLTMHESGQMVYRALEAGAHGYVTKSDLPKELVKAVRNVSQGKLFFTPEIYKVVINGFLKGGMDSSATNTSSKVHPTSRQTEIIRLLAQGKSNKEVASALNISVRTAETHRARIMQKFGLHSLVDLIHYAVRNGIISTREF